MPKLESLSRRVYNLYSHHGQRDVNPTQAKHVLMVSLETDKETEDEFNKWYEEEHMILVSKTPGWLRGRRYVLDPAETTARGLATSQKVIKYLAIHEFENGDFESTAELKKAVSTEWRAEIMKHLAGREYRKFVLETAFTKA
jgi:hypothetical protein